MTRRELLALGFGAALSALAGCGTNSTDTSEASVFGPSASPLPSPGASPGASPSPSPVVPGADLTQPRVLTSQGGTLDATLRVMFGTNDVGGQRLTSRTYEGVLCGPTLRVKPGETLKFTVDNQLPENEDENTDYPDMNTPHHFNSTNNHTHGLHVSPSGNSDNIFVDVKPGEKFQYQYDLPANHPAGTMWYHPHRHGSSSVQLVGGMSGMLIIEGDIDQVPEIAAARDIVFMINDIYIDPETGMTPDFLPDKINPVADEFLLEERTITVNGQVNPTLRVQPGEVVRLRILNACLQTFTPLKVDGHDLHVCSMDGITLPRARRTSDDLLLGPANRADVLLVGGAPGTYAIRKTGPNSVTLADDPDVQIATLVVEGAQKTMSLPTTLPAPLKTIEASEITGRRTLVFTISLDGPPGPPRQPVPRYLNFSIDGKRFDKDRIDHTVNLGAVEEWTLINASPSGHPFHIHINPFQVISVNGKALAEPEWRDTIMIPPFLPETGPGTVVIRHRFEDFKGLFVLHCHILVHEDLGMMQTVNVI